MAKINVEIYEKTQSFCRYCISVGHVFSKWREQTSDEVEFDVYSAEEHAEELNALGAKQAPVYIVEREGATEVISGNNPDKLIDVLNGNSSIWD